MKDSYLLADQMEFVSYEDEWTLLNKIGIEMLAVRIAYNNPDKDDLRPVFLDAHKAHLRSGAVDVVMAGSLKAGEGGQGGSMIVANVGDLRELAEFNAADPFVREGIYDRFDIFEWTVTLDSRR